MLSNFNDRLTTCKSFSETYCKGVWYYMINTLLSKRTPEVEQTVLPSGSLIFKHVLSTADIHSNKKHN